MSDVSSTFCCSLKLRAAIKESSCSSFTSSSKIMILLSFASSISFSSSNRSSLIFSSGVFLGRKLFVFQLSVNVSEIFVISLIASTIKSNYPIANGGLATKVYCEGRNTSHDGKASPLAIFTLYLVLPLPSK